MAKKKHSESHVAESGEEATMPESTSVDEQATPKSVAEELGELGDEVQSFITRRDELARKLEQEIEATERKLAELKRTAALLFPQNGVQSQAEKDRQDRKPKKTIKVPKPQPAQTVEPQAPKEDGNSSAEPAES